MWELLYRVLGRDQSCSRQHAKERLHLVLVHDRANISPYLMNRLKEDLIQVISKYMIIDEESMEIQLGKDDNNVALVANIPIKQIRRDYRDHLQESS